MVSEDERREREWEAILQLQVGFGSSVTYFFHILKGTGDMGGVQGWAEASDLTVAH